MAFNSTTGLGTPTQLVVAGNDVNVHGSQKVVLSLTSAGWPTTFQLEPLIQDAGGNELAAGTAFTLTSVASASPGSLTLSAVAAPTSTGGVTTAVYTGTITGGGSNALAGATFLVAGFTNASNNGTFQATASTTTTLTLTNIASIAETHAGTAVDQQSTAVYTGTITGGGSNAFAGETFVVTGFATAGNVNNGTFIATASSATTLTLGNQNAVAETHAGTATNQEATALTYVVYGASTNSGGTYKPVNNGKVAIATVSATGLLTAVAEGRVTGEVSYPAFNNSIGDIVSSGNIMNGLPIAKIYAEVNIVVLA